MSADVATLEQEASSLTAAVAAMAVTDAPSFERAGEFLRGIATYIKRVGEVLDPIVDANYRAHKIAVAQRDALLKPAQSAKRVLGERMATWEEEQSRLRREAELAAQREQERLERDARAQAEAEQRRLQEEAETRRLEEAAALEAAGDTAAAEQLIATPVARVVVAPAAIFTPRPMVACPPKLDGVSFREDWDFEIVNAALIPKEYMIPDEKKIRGVVRAMKGQAGIPGVRVFPRRGTAVRSSS